MDTGLISDILEWAIHGWWAASFWQLLGFVLVITHLTMISVTIYLHRHQAHRSLDLHPLASHVFRFWLWLTTGQITREWTAIHRKHHAKCEQPEDPHSPQTRGLRTVLLRGYELYRAEAANQETLARFGHGTPQDWVEQHIYAGHANWGIAFMLLIDLALFGVIGLTVWAIQMIWTPVMAAGIINGAGHYLGYRNFESPDASTNLLPWGVLIAGEELHNNHHTYPTSARLSVKRYEFDVGWLYIRMLERMRLAKVKKRRPRLTLGAMRPVADGQTLDALIQNRFELMASYARSMRQMLRAEAEGLRSLDLGHGVLRAAKSWMHRDLENVPSAVLPKLHAIRAALPGLDQMVVMREELRTLWQTQIKSRDQLVADLQVWCQRAEASGIAALREFSMHLRAVRV